MKSTVTVFRITRTGLFMRACLAIMNQAVLGDCYSRTKIALWASSSMENTMGSGS